MNLHEYQAKEVIAGFGINTQLGSKTSLIKTYFSIKFSCLIICLFALNIGSSQHYKCGTDQSDLFMKHLRENKKNFDVTRNKGKMENFIPITFHSIADSLGNGRVSDIEIYKGLCQLNLGFEETGMRFFIKEINYINKSSLDTLVADSTPSKFQPYIKPNSINVFVPSEASGVLGDYFGYYQRTADVVVVVKLALTNGNTLMHELGHYFTLPDTHNGWEGNPYNPSVHGDTIDITTVPSVFSGDTTFIELMDGSNCNNAGDEICDTPPDYGFGQSCSCCTMVFDVWDSNGDKVVPIMDNVMSYSYSCDKRTFTEGQSTAMLTDYDSEKRDSLRLNSVNSYFYTPISEEATLLSPIGLVNNYNSVFFDWENVANSESYLLQIVQVRDQIKFDYLTKDSDLIVNDLKPNMPYTYQVFPLNKFGTFCSANNIKIFSTGSETTSISEIESFKNVGIHPNPVSMGLDINIFITADEAMSSKVSLLDLIGNVVLTQNESILSGENQFKIKTSSITSGLYVVEVQTANGRMTDKVFIK